MRFDIVSIFPKFFDGPLDYGIVRRAREAGLVEVHVHDLREFTRDRHRTVDDRPFGGGEGMVLKPEPLFEAVERLLGVGAQSGQARQTTGRPGTTIGPSEGPAPTASTGEPGTDAEEGARGAGQPGVAVPSSTAIVLLSASGVLFRQDTARRGASMERIVLLCGRYEGVDERVAEHLATEEIAVGNFVLSGGELPAAMIMDAVTRLLPGALGNEASAVHESFSIGDSAQPLATSSQLSIASSQSAVRGGEARASSFDPPAANREPPVSSVQLRTSGILECPHYTRPADFRGWQVPEALMSGNHEQIRRWRRKMALAKTLRNRPDLLAGVGLSDEDRRLLDELKAED